MIPCWAYHPFDSFTPVDWFVGEVISQYIAIRPYFPICAIAVPWISPTLVIKNGMRMGIWFMHATMIYVLCSKHGLFAQERQWSPISEHTDLTKCLHCKESHRNPIGMTIAHQSLNVAGADEGGDYGHPSERDLRCHGPAPRYGNLWCRFF